MPVICSTIHKGGSGKTTLALHLAYYLAEQRSKATGEKNRVLVIDCDPQGNATQTLTDEDVGEFGASRLFVADPPPAMPVTSMFPGIMVIGADAGLLDLEGMPRGVERTFRENVRHLLHSFEHIVIDTPPTMGNGMLAPLVASDFAISPLEAGPFNLRGIQSILDKISEVQQQYNPDLQYLGFLVNRFNKRNIRQIEIVEALKEQLADNLVPHLISERSPIAQVAYTREPVWASKTTASRVAARELRGALGWIAERLETR